MRSYIIKLSKGLEVDILTCQRISKNRLSRHSKNIHLEQQKRICALTS